MSDPMANALTSNWVWIPDWKDGEPSGSAGRLVAFYRSFQLESAPDNCQIHLTADTRYKLFINDERVTFGPCRGDPKIWFYDSIDIGPYLRIGENVIRVVVMRWFKAGRAGHPFARADLPGFSMVGRINTVDLNPTKGWKAVQEEGTRFPTGLVDDVFLHINERVTSHSEKAVDPIAYDIRCVNGELSPWNLFPRTIPLPEQTAVNFVAANNASGPCWSSLLSASGATRLRGGTHAVDLLAACHSTAFLAFTFTGKADVTLKVTYSEGYEDEPRQYPWLRTKSDRIDSSKQLHGPCDIVIMRVDGEYRYEPFWFRTFRILRIEMNVDVDGEVAMGIEATQTNYPMEVAAKWRDDSVYGDRIWNISLRTIRNCMVDGYSDCPFYEQLMYAGDARSVGLFHYLSTGDDRLGRHAIRLFTASAISFPGGTLTQSRFPSHILQIIAGFPLYYIMSVCDHYLYFGDRSFVLQLLPTIYGILQWYDSHIDSLGLVSGMPDTVWQYVDWVTTWSASDEHPDKGVPTAGRKSNRHTFFSLLYAYALGQVVQLLEWIGRPGMAEEYKITRENVNRAVRKHCYDAESGMFTDSTTAESLAHDLPAFSQHCQIFAVLSGAAADLDQNALLTNAFTRPGISKCSYVMLFYAFRAMSHIGQGAYERFYPQIIQNWHHMIDNNMTTWEEDDVRQRSDCHAWGSVPIYEFATEIAGVHVVGPGSSRIRWHPRRLVNTLEATVCIGDKQAKVEWSAKDERKEARISFQKPVELEVMIEGVWKYLGERCDYVVTLT